MWKRLAILPLQVLLALLVVELGLQVAAWFARRDALSALPTSFTTGRLRVLCLGDSNTYGLYLERNESWPAQLEALWQEAHGPSIEVLNLGFPGTNSSRVVRDFSRLLEAFGPDVVVVMVGVNDFWTRPFPLDDVRDPDPPGLLERHSRLYRMFHLIRRGLDARELEIEIDSDLPEATQVPTERSRRRISGARHQVRYGDEVFEMSFERAVPGASGDAESLRRNLGTLVEQARTFGTRLVLMSYPARSNFYAPASHALRSIALRTGTDFVDLEEIFRPLCPKRCPDLLFEDGHPNAAGYAVVAEAVAALLAQAEGQVGVRRADAPR